MKRLSWWAIPLAYGLAVPAQAQTDDGVYLMSPEWVSLSKHQTSPDGSTRVFRKYAATKDERQELANLIVFHCPLNRQKYPYFSIQLPLAYETRSFPRSKWLPRTTVRALVGQQSIELPAEYRDGEIYIDLTPQTTDALADFMKAEHTVLAFGGKNDKIAFGFHSSVASNYREAFSKPDIRQRFGAPRWYTSRAMMDECIALRSKR